MKLFSRVSEVLLSQQLAEENFYRKCESTEKSHRIFYPEISVACYTSRRPNSLERAFKQPDKNKD